MRENLLTLERANYKKLETKFENYKKDEEKRINELVTKAVTFAVEETKKTYEKEINEYKNEINRLKARLGIDSTNSGLPTSKNSIGKQTIQNNRETSDKPKGGQAGHPQAKLEYFKEEEITHKEDLTLDKCPNCGGDLIETNIVKSDIIDVTVTVTKTRYNIHNYKCKSCHKNVTANSDLPRGASYGNNVNAIALSLMNEANTALNKVSSVLSGISNNEINMSEGYLIKLQKKSSEKLTNFIYDLKEKVVLLDRIFWDDTTVNFGIEKPAEGYDEKDLKYLEEGKNKKVREGTIRFYGDDNLALLIGHRNKNFDSINDDDILSRLSENCVVMHDHLLLNYNDKYKFKNAECNEHIKRALKKNMGLLPNHKWAGEMRKLLVDTNKEKGELIENKISSFSNKKLEEISQKYDEIIKLAYKENEDRDIEKIQAEIDELNLIERLDKFKENHLLFAYDFSVEFTNNTSERGLRQVKRKLAVSFMFKNANRMKDYAKIISYLETCHRNGITRFEAAKRLVSNNPYTINEIFPPKEKEE